MHRAFHSHLTFLPEQETVASGAWRSMARLLGASTWAAEACCVWTCTLTGAYNVLLHPGLRQRDAACFGCCKGRGTPAVVRAWHSDFQFLYLRLDTHTPSPPAPPAHRQDPPPQHGGTLLPPCSVLALGSMDGSLSVLSLSDGACVAACSSHAKYAGGYMVWTSGAGHLLVWNSGAGYPMV